MYCCGTNITSPKVVLCGIWCLALFVNCTYGFSIPNKVFFIETLELSQLDVSFGLYMFLVVVMRCILWVSTFPCGCGLSPAGTRC